MLGKVFRTTRTLYFETDEGYISDKHPVKLGAISKEDYKEEVEWGTIIVIRKGTYYVVAKWGKDKHEDYTFITNGIVLVRKNKPRPSIIYKNKSCFWKDGWFEEVKKE